MSKCGPVNSQSSRRSSDVPIHSPLRVPTSSTVPLMARAILACLPCTDMRR